MRVALREFEFETIPPSWKGADSVEREKGTAEHSPEADDLNVKRHVRILLQRLLARQRARSSAAVLSEESCQG